MSKETLPWLSFKGKSSLELGLVIVKKNTFNGAARDVTYYGVPGRSGDLVIDNGRYKNLTVSYEMTLLNTTPFNFSELTQLIRDWLLSETGYFTLWDTYDSQYFRYASYSGEVDIEQIQKDEGRLILDFNCKPYRYAREGQQPILLPSAGTIYNSEAYPSEPYIKVNGSGTITLTVNGTNYTLSDIDGYIELDSELMDAFKGSTLLNNSMTGGTFPLLLPGQNTISWSGNGTVTTLEIIPRWRRL